jgi:hypothetical protein
VEIQLHHDLSWHHSLFPSWIMRKRMRRGARTRMRRVMFFNLRNLRNSGNLMGGAIGDNLFLGSWPSLTYSSWSSPRTGFLQVTTANKQAEPDLR